MGIINKLILGGGMVAGAAQRVASRATLVPQAGAYGAIGFSRLFKKVKPDISNLYFGVGVKHPYMLTGLIGAGALSYGMGAQTLRGTRALGETSYAGPAPQFMYDYTKNIDKMMMAQQGMPSAVNNMGADGDLVLALAQNKGRQL